MNNSREILSMNLKYYRQKYLVYINELENCKRKPTIEMLDKIAENMNKNIDRKLKMTASDLLKYDKTHRTTFNRIDERK